MNKKFKLGLTGYVGVILCLSCLCKPMNGMAQNRIALPQKHEVGPTCMPDTLAPVTAPFPMPAMQLPSFPDQEVTVSMPTQGLSTQRIQEAIDQLAEEGGGTVIIPSGRWKTGRITLRNHINLHLSEGAELHFSGEIEDYLPVVFTRDEDIDIYSLGACIYACDAENIAVTGSHSPSRPSVFDRALATVPASSSALASSRSASVILNST